MEFLVLCSCIFLTGIKIFWSDSGSVFIFLFILTALNIFQTNPVSIGDLPVINYIIEVYCVNGHKQVESFAKYHNHEILIYLIYG